jgi:hypothetical protein
VRCAYLFAIIPLLGAIVEAFVSGNSTNSDKFGAFHFIWAYFVAYAVVAWMDSKVIRRSGHHAIPPTRWFWLAPAYLWVRAKRLGQKKVYFWVWAVSIILAIMIDQPAIKGAVYLGFSLPHCTTAFATSHISNLFPNIPVIKMTWATVVGVEKIVDEGIVDGHRVCHAVIVTSLDKTIRVHYQIEPSGDNYYLRINIE